MRASRLGCQLCLAGLICASTAVQAQQADRDTAFGNSLQEVVIVGTTPVPGARIDADKLPGHIQTISSSDITREGDASVIAAMNNGVGSVNINDDLDDPFQPDILFRGFEASPVLGTPQGLAVYQNGVRINEAFGDTVNWDLFPDIAIDRLDVFGANPVYGLNALGGAVVVTMKNGFSSAGTQAQLSGGSWGQRQGSVQFATNNGAWGVYAAARLLKQDGWRQLSADTVRQLYAALSFRSSGVTFDLSFTGADNNLSGESPSPVQELAVSRSLIFTSPQSNANRLSFTAANVSYAASDALSVQANAYYRDFRQFVINGNTTDFTACTTDANADELCQADGETPALDAAGRALPDISAGGALIIGENDIESIRTVSGGGALQATSTAVLFGHDNHLSIGGSVDSAATDFDSYAQLGTINQALQVSVAGPVVVTPENTNFSATPVGLHATNRYYGIYLTDTANVTDALAVTVSGRYNVAQVDLSDRRGTALSGDNRYSRFNPAIGLADKLNRSVTAYGGYSQGNRVPTAGEIECSNPSAPCLLPSSLSSDPPRLRQVISHTWEAGLRGSVTAAGADDSLIPGHIPGRISWNASLFRTDVRDDIYGVATSVSSGYFQNIGGTRRQGVELGLSFRGERLNAFADYSYVAATFRSSLLLPSQRNAFADGDGNIQVRSGDVLPCIPKHRIKAGADLRPVPAWTIGATLVFESSQFFRGDESNQMPPLASFVVVSLHSKYRLSEHLEVYANIVNLLNRHYATFGSLGDPTGIGAPGVPVGADTNDAGVDNRFESPAPPLSAFGGVRFRF